MSELMQVSVSRSESWMVELRLDWIQLLVKLVRLVTVVLWMQDSEALALHQGTDDIDFY